MRTLFGPISFLVLTAVLLGTAATASKASRKAAVKGAICMNELGCKAGEKCVKYPPQKQGFCAENSAPTTFQPSTPTADQSAGRSTCSIAAEGQCLKK
jgi:hypothetical protein